VLSFIDEAVNTTIREELEKQDYPSIPLKKAGDKPALTK